VRVSGASQGVSLRSPRRNAGGILPANGSKLSHCAFWGGRADHDWLQEAGSVNVSFNVGSVKKYNL
jgi:hypothetical protein